MYKILLTVILMISFVSGAMGQELTLSLDQAKEMALEKNIEVNNANLEMQENRYQLKEQKSQLYPQLEAFSDFDYYYAVPKTLLPGEILGESGQIPVEMGTTFDWNSGFRATQLLYDQSYFTSLKLTRQKKDMKELDVQKQKEEVAYQVSRVYYLARATNRQLKHYNMSIENMKQLLEIARLQQQNEVIRRLDRDQVEVDMNNLQTEADQLEVLYKKQIRLLQFLTGVDYDTDIQLSDSLVYTPGEVNRQTPAWSKMTELQIADQQIEIARLSNSIDKQSYWPTLSATFQYYYQGQRNQFDFFEDGDDKFFKAGFVGLSLSIPLFNGFQKQAQISQNKIQLKQLRNSRRNTARSLHKDLLDAREAYEKNRRVLTRQKKNIAVAEENYRISLLAYKNQTLALADLLRAQNSLVEARLSYDDALLKLKNAELDLKKSSGALLD